MKKISVELDHGDSDPSDFTVEQLEDKTVVRYGNSSTRWNYPGKEAYTITTDGNGSFFVKDHITKKTAKIEIGQLEALEMVRKLLGETPKVFKKELVS